VLRISPARLGVHFPSSCSHAFVRIYLQQHTQQCIPAPPVSRCAPLTPTLLGFVSSGHSSSCFTHGASASRLRPRHSSFTVAAAAYAPRVSYKPSFACSLVIVSPRPLRGLRRLPRLGLVSLEAPTAPAILHNSLPPIRASLIVPFAAALAARPLSQASFSAPGAARLGFLPCALTQFAASPPSCTSIPAFLCLQCSTASLFPSFSLAMAATPRAFFARVGSCLPLLLFLLSPLSSQRSPALVLLDLHPRFVFVMVLLPATLPAPAASHVHFLAFSLAPLLIPFHRVSGHYARFAQFSFTVGRTLHDFPYLVCNSHKRYFSSSACGQDDSSFFCPFSAVQLTAPPFIRNDANLPI